MRFIVTGSTGMLGAAVVRELQRRSAQYRAFAHTQLDITDWEAVHLQIRPDDIVINCAGIVRGRMDPPARFVAVNAQGPHWLAERAKRVLQVSTDCVFDGASEVPYTEESQPTPPDLYGRTKLAGELEAPHLTVRTSFIGLGARGLVAWMMNRPQGATIHGFVGASWNGWYAEDLAPFLVTLAISPTTGLLHLPGAFIDKADLVGMLAQRIRPDLHVERVPVPPTFSRNMVLGTLYPGHASPPLWTAALAHLYSDLHP